MDISANDKTQDDILVHSKSDHQSSNHRAKPMPTFGWRHFQTMLMFLGLTAAYTLRVNLSVAIVTMVSTDGSAGGFETFEWNSSAQSYILSSFFWGYTMTQLIGGQVAERWDSQKLFAISLFVSGTLAALNPLAASLGGWKLLCACRLLMGLSQGCIYPTVHTLLSKWAPLGERGYLGTVVYAGAQFGSIVAMTTSGLLSASSVGWPSVFYLFGAVCVLWSIIWIFLGCESPGKHSSISPEERQFIEQSLKSDGEHKILPTPWKAILTSHPVWALVIANSGHMWGFWMLLTEIPTYLDGVLGFSMTVNGLVSALPYFMFWVLGYPMSYTSDWLFKRGYTTVGMSRKISNSIGFMIPAIGLMGLGYVDKENKILAISILVIAVGFNAGSLCGYQINHMDLSPNFAGTLMGLTNTFGCVCAILAPLLNGLVVTDSTNMTQWRTVFFLTSGIFILTNLYFVLFGSGKVQWWNDPENTDNGSEKSSSYEKDTKEEERIRSNDKV